MKTHDIIPHSFQDKTQRLQDLCEMILTRFEQSYHHNASSDDTKELTKLDLLLKLRAKLIDIDQAVRMSSQDTPNVTNHYSREDVLESLFRKIKKTIKQTSL